MWLKHWVRRETKTANLIGFVLWLLHMMMKWGRGDTGHYGHRTGHRPTRSTLGRLAKLKITEFLTQPTTTTKRAVKGKYHKNHV